MLIEQGVSPKAVQARLGHENIETTFFHVQFQQKALFYAHQQYARLCMIIIVQTQAHIFLNDWKPEFDGLEPLAIGLPILINVNFRN